MLLLVLHLNCFTETTVVYGVQDQILELRGSFDSSLQEIDKQSCELFFYLQTIATVQIGTLVFKSNYTTYNGQQMLYQLTLFEGDIAFIQQFSVAIFSIQTKDNAISQSGTAIQFSIRNFDHRNCFKDITLLYNSTINEISINVTKQHQCSFLVDGSINAQVYYQNGTDYINIFNTTLPAGYGDWFTTIQSCTTDLCNSFIPDFQVLLFPNGYYNVLIEQKFDKETLSFNESGDNIVQTSNFVTSLKLRQHVDLFRSQFLIPSISDISIRPFSEQIEIIQKVDISIPFEFRPGFNQFRTTFCVAKGEQSDEFYCFNINRADVEFVPRYLYVCSEHDEFPTDICNEMVLNISKFTSGQGMLWYETLFDGDVQQSISYRPPLSINQFEEVKLSIFIDKVCLVMNLKNGVQIEKQLLSFALKWSTSGHEYSLNNNFQFPQSGTYCMDIDDKQFRLMTSEQVGNFIINYGDQYLYVNIILKLVKLEQFNYGLIALGIMLALQVGILVLVIWSKARRTR